MDASGSDVTSQITPEMASTNAITYTYMDPTFSLTVMKNLNLMNDKYFIIPSDVFYNDINEVCSIIMHFFVLNSIDLIAVQFDNLSEFLVKFACNAGENRVDTISNGCCHETEMEVHYIVLNFYL